MKKFLGILLLVGIVYALLHFKGCSGLGKGKGDDGVSSAVKATQSYTEADTVNVSAEITVSGSDYIFNNKKISLNDLIKEISSLDKEAVITISSDDTAAKNTVDELTDKLEELGYSFKKTDK